MEEKKNEQVKGERNAGGEEMKHKHNHAGNENSANHASDVKENTHAGKVEAENGGGAKSEQQKPQDVTQTKEYQALLSSYNALKKEVSEAKEYVKSYKADLDRIKERSQNLNAELTEKVNVDAGKKLLPILDNFEKSFAMEASDASEKGFRMIFNQLQKVLEHLKIKQYEVTEEFNPQHMEAVFVEPTDDAEQDGKVAKVLQNGYFYEPTEKVVRPVMVSVYSKQ